MNWPLVCYTGASVGLTPFCAYFIDYVAYSIPVGNILMTNTMIVIGTALHKFECQVKPMYLPCLSYHLSYTDIYVSSSPTYAILYGEHSTMFGDRVVTMIDHLPIIITTTGEAENVPMI